MASLDGKVLSNETLNQYTYLYLNKDREEERKYTVRDLIRDLLDADLDSEIEVNDFKIIAVDSIETNTVKLSSENIRVTDEQLEEYSNKLLYDTFSGTSMSQFDYDKTLYNRLRERRADENTKRDNWEDLMGDTNETDLYNL